MVGGLPIYMILLGLLVVARRPSSVTSENQFPRAFQKQVISPRNFTDLDNCLLLLGYPPSCPLPFPFPHLHKLGEPVAISTLL